MSQISQNRMLPTEVSDGRDGVETLAGLAHRRLREDIIRGVRKPGERLRIDRLKSIYGIGPTPLREALQKLSADGLVITEGNRGFTVAPLEATEFEDLNMARTAIETAAIRLSIVNGDDRWESRVVAAHYLLSKEDQSLRATDDDRVPDSWEEANAAFHTAIVSACGSDSLLRVRASLADLVERYRRASVYQKRGQRRLDVEHAEIRDAVLDRDAQRACQLTTRHFELTARSLVDAAD